MTVKARTVVPKLDISEFIDQFANKQYELLSAIAEKIQKGEIKLSGEKTADGLVEGIIDEWCQEEEPDIGQHMRMCAAVFLWAMQDELYVDSVEAKERGAAGGAESTTVKITMEVLKTIQAIWARK